MKSEPKFNIVLVNPEIPQNTGGIGRLCVSTSSRLHLIKPLGFSLEDKFVKRAGMDYWPHLELFIYEDWQDFLDKNPDSELIFLSTKGEKCYWDYPIPANSYLIFGSESHGLPQEFYERYCEQMRIIPMPGEFHRSLNLANSAAIALYEAMRQNR